MRIPQLATRAGPHGPPRPLCGLRCKRNTVAAVRLGPCPGLSGNGCFYVGSRPGVIDQLPVDVSCDEALQASHDDLLAEALGGSSGGVGRGLGIALHANQADGVAGSVGLPITASVQAEALGLPLEAEIGLTPHSTANEGSLASRSGLSLAAIMRVGATSPRGRASRRGSGPGGQRSPTAPAPRSALINHLDCLGRVEWWHRCCTSLL